MVDPLLRVVSLHFSLTDGTKFVITFLYKLIINAYHQFCSRSTVISLWFTINFVIFFVTSYLLLLCKDYMQCSTEAINIVSLSFIRFERNSKLLNSIIFFGNFNWNIGVCDTLKRFIQSIISHLFIFSSSLIIYKFRNTAK